MEVRNIINKVEKQYPAEENLSNSFIESIYYPRTNPSGFITSAGNNIISGDNTFYGDQYLFSGTDVLFSGAGSFQIDNSVSTKGVVKDLGGVSGIRVMTTGEYNSITPLSGVVYILT